MTDLSKYSTYENYLDSFITQKDRDYLGSIDVARDLIELNLVNRSGPLNPATGMSSNILSRKEFEEQKAQSVATQNANAQGTITRTSLSKDVDLQKFPLLKALRDREEQLLNGKLLTIVFIRDKNHSGQEISGYIDVEQRMRTDNFSQYFLRQRKLFPKPSDLSFYNWDTQFSCSGTSPNFETISDHEEGLLFKCKADRAIISVDPSAPPTDRTTRYVIDTHEHLQVVLYDHALRRAE